jgi:hypothetical protein
VIYLQWKNYSYQIYRYLAPFNCCYYFGQQSHWCAEMVEVTLTMAHDQVNLIMVLACLLLPCFLDFVVDVLHCPMSCPAPYYGLQTCLKHNKNNVAYVTTALALRYIFL